MESGGVSRLHVWGRNRCILEQVCEDCFSVSNVAELSDKAEIWRQTQIKYAAFHAEIQYF